MSADSLYREDLAYIHHVGFGDFARRASPELLRLIHKSDIVSGTIVDLGCGSGLWAHFAQSNGFKVIGVDQSAAMVRLAKTVAPHSEFVCSSLYDFQLPQCDVVTILGEGLNYLSPGNGSGQQFHRFFSRVAAALKPGGLFIFDVILREGGPMNYRKWWEGKDWAVLVDFKEGKSRRILVRDIVTFRKLGTSWRRGQEEHRIGLFSRAEILKGLRKAGFSVRVVRAYAGFHLPPRRLGFIGHVTGRRKDRNR